MNGARPGDLAPFQEIVAGRAAHQVGPLSAFVLGRVGNRLIEL
jgi:hypothetical protein